MSKKQDSFYFENFINCTDYACQAAHMLDKVLRDFDPDHMEQHLAAMHKVEHGADEEKHKLLNVLVKAFITPIEREDILLLSQNLDEITDQIEDVLLRVYCNNVRSIRADALDLVAVAIQCCEEAKLMMEEFADFRHSKNLHEHIVKINTLEEDADQLFINSLRNLHTTCAVFITVTASPEIYTYLERCVDACEHAADTVESIVMKNS